MLTIFEFLDGIQDFAYKLSPDFMAYSPTNIYGMGRRATEFIGKQFDKDWSGRDSEDSEAFKLAKRAAQNRAQNTDVSIQDNALLKKVGKGLVNANNDELKDYNVKAQQDQDQIDANNRNSIAKKVVGGIAATGLGAAAYLHHKNNQARNQSTYQ